MNSVKQTTKDTSSRLVTHLDIRLGGAGQGAADRRPVAGEKRLAVVSGGPAELLGWLETRLGLVPDDQPRAARVLSYARALDRARPPEVAASFEQDRWGTASELLRRREELRLAGWEGTAQATYPPVVQALAAVERQLDESITDTAARLNAVLAALDMGQRLPAHRLVSDHIEAWPLCWQRVLQHLDAAPPGPTKPAAPKGPLRVVQRQLLSARRQLFLPADDN
jgi:hypothetical protein